MTFIVELWILTNGGVYFSRRLFNFMEPCKIQNDMRYADKIPYNFVLDYLPDQIEIKPMFGCYGIYANGRLCLFLMNRERPLMRRDAEPMQKGVYIATSEDRVAELKPLFPEAEFEHLKAGKIWIFVSETLPEFESNVIKACEMIAVGDARIGRE